MVVRYALSIVFRGASSDGMVNNFYTRSVSFL